jgi:hypothetical protein
VRPDEPEHFLLRAWRAQVGEAVNGLGLQRSQRGLFENLSFDDRSLRGERKRQELREAFLAHRALHLTKKGERDQGSAVVRLSCMHGLIAKHLGHFRVFTGSSRKEPACRLGFSFGGGSRPIDKGRNGLLHCLSRSCQRRGLELGPSFQ